MAEQKFVSKENLSAIWAGIRAFVLAQKHLPDGGVAGQILQRTSSGYDWINNLTMDDSLSTTSENPVKNKTVNAAIEALKAQIAVLENYDDEEIRGLIEELDAAVKALHNYDDTALKAEIESIKTSITGLTTKDGELAAKDAELVAKDAELEGKIKEVKDTLDDLLNTDNANGVIDTFKEIENFLTEISDSDTLTELLASMESSIKSTLTTEINKKIDMPTGGTTGQILTKTEDGVAWSTVTIPETDTAYTDDEILSIFTS